MDECGRRLLQVGRKLRTSADRREHQPVVDGTPNFFHLTYCNDDRGQAQLTSGINQMLAVDAPDGDRCPAILLRTSTHMAGSETTPWHDAYDMDGGRVRYFGDAKVDHMPDPSRASNKVLLEQQRLHTSPSKEERLQAAPLLFFVSSESGYAEFRGIGLIESVELVTQIEPKSGLPFSNYAFDCALLDLAPEGEHLDWAWICARRNDAVSADEAALLAPRSWQEWINRGSEAVSKVRRVVSRSGTWARDDQLPQPATPEADVLQQVYEFYGDGTGRPKARFEAVAEVVAEFVIGESHGRYRTGWITRGSGDHGIDFVGRLDVGSGFSETSLVVLGQAKCEAPTSTTSGTHIARTVARLRRGWIGCYVTTAAFSVPTQREVAEDRYPLVMIPGLRVAEAIRTIALRDGVRVGELLERIDSTYEERLRDRDPEQVLVL